MGVIISPIVRTTLDVAGNAMVDVYGVFEYRATGILPTGESLDLSAYMRRVEQVQVNRISGAITHVPQVNATDYPGDAGSGRMELYITPASGLAAVALASGTAVSGARAYIHAFGY